MLGDNLGPRQVAADFSGGHLSIDGSALLLRQTNRGLNVSRSPAACFHDARDPRWVEHGLSGLLATFAYLLVERLRALTLRGAE